MLALLWYLNLLKVRQPHSLSGVCFEIANHYTHIFLVHWFCSVIASNRSNWCWAHCCGWAGWNLCFGSFASGKKGGTQTLTRLVVACVCITSGTQGIPTCLTSQSPSQEARKAGMASGAATDSSRHSVGMRMSACELCLALQNQGWRISASTASPGQGLAALGWAEMGSWALGQGIGEASEEAR